MIATGEAEAYPDPETEVERALAALASALSEGIR